MEKIDLAELGLDGGDGGKGALTAIPRTPPTYSNIELIAIDSIRIPPDRQRGDKINGRGEDELIKGLEDSFEAIGFFGAIIVSKDSLPSAEGGKQYKLIAGRRRLAACRSPHIPAQVVALHADDDSPEATLEMIELFEDLRRLQRDSINVMHSRKRIADLLGITEGLNQTKVAKRIGITKQQLSISISNSKFATAHPEKVDKCKTEEQVREVRERHDRIARERQMLALQEDLGEQRRFEIKIADFHEWASTYRGPPFDVGNVDFPWGIGQDKFGQSSRTAPRYEDSPEVFERLCETLWMYSDRLFAQSAHLIFWFSIARYSKVHDRLVGMGWEVNPHPFIWVKPTAGIVPRPGHDLRQAYEAAFICTRGGRLLSTKRNWFDGDPPDDRFHQSQKNESMMEHLLSAFVTDSTRVLDPTCGSGVAIKIAKRLGAHSALGLELDEESAVLARAALRSEPEPGGGRNE